MYKIPDQVVQFIEKIMETWRVELTTGRESLTEVMIQRGTFQEDSLATLLFVITMIPLNPILTKCTAGYKLSKSQEKINHLMMYMDDFKLFAKNEKEVKTLIQTMRKYSQDIGIEFGRKKCTMLVMKSGKGHMTEGVELPNKNAQRKGNLPMLEDIGS